MGRSQETQPILGSSETIYQSVRRPWRDTSWAVVYLLSLGLAIAGGVYAGIHRNKDFATLVSPDYLADPAHCPADQLRGGPSRRLLLADGDDGRQYQPTFFLEAAGALTAASIGGGLLLGLAGLALVRRFPHACVGAAVGLQVLLPAMGGLLLLANGAGGGAVPLLLGAAILAFVFYLYRQQLALVGRLLAVSSTALWNNCAAIVGGSLLLQAAGLLVALPLAVFFVLAFANGGVVPNPAVASITPASGGAAAVAAPAVAATMLTATMGAAAGGGGPATLHPAVAASWLGGNPAPPPPASALPTCVDAQGRQVLCCAWQPDGWALGYMAWAALMLGWSTLLAFTVKVYVVSGVTAQWYFAPAGASPAARGSLGTALRHAFGPSLGSLCLASWLLNLLSMLKSMAQSAAGENRDNLLVQLLAACFEFLLTLLEAVTKFAVVRMAITGEALLASCRSTADLLARNLLDSVGVWWLPGMVLQVTALLLSGLWGGAVAGASYAAWGRTQVAASSGLALGGVSFLVGWVVLSYLNSVLLSVVDAVYICFAMDRDVHACTRPEVHQVYVLLPSNKAPLGVVENPDGGYAFGASAPAAPGAPFFVPHAPAPYPSPPAPGVSAGAAYGQLQPPPGYPSAPPRV